MPIKTAPVTALNLFAIKRAIEKLSRNAFKLNNTSQGDELFTTALPTVGEMDEGSAQFVNDSGTWKLCFRINATRYTATLTAE